MTRILITGARDWSDAEKVHHELNRAVAQLCPMYPDGVDWDTRDLVLVHGACPTGADFIANEWAIINFIDVDPLGGLVGQATDLSSRDNPQRSDCSADRRRIASRDDPKRDSLHATQCDTDAR